MRVLILSLGVGSLNNREITNKEAYIKEEIIEKGVFPYNTATYRFKGNDKTYSSPFVAEPLIDEFKPDIVVVLGTVKSCWSSFYAKFATNENNETKVEQILKLFDSEESNGLNTSEEDRELIEEEICSSFKNLNVQCGEKTVELKPVIIPYGLEDGDPQVTYRKIREVLGEIFNKGESFEVAFDITHSFRSMPIYNLVVTDYYASLQNKKISISKVYYGNLDASRENDGIAEIVDLSDIVNILTMTGGVREFKNTGSPVTLTYNIKDGDLKRLLDLFDLAMQTNAFDRLNDAIIKLLGYLDGEGNGEIETADQKTMVRYALGKALMNDETLDSNKWGKLRYWDKQYYIGRWLLEQKRYGLASVLGLEATRSYLCTIYKRGDNSFLSEEEVIEEEETRRDTIRRLRREGFKEYDGEICSCLCNLSNSVEKCTTFRNVFAHNLMEKHDTAGLEVEDYNIENREDIERMLIGLFDNLAWLKEQIACNLLEIRNAYNKETERNVRNKKNNKPVRVIVTDMESITDFESLRKTNNNEYDLYCVDSDVRKHLRENYVSAEIRKDALMLYHLLVHNDVLNDAKTQIVFVNMSWKQMYFYFTLLRAAIRGNKMLRADLEKKPPEDIPGLITEDAVQEMLNETMDEKRLKLSSHSLEVIVPKASESKENGNGTKDGQPAGDNNAIGEALEKALRKRNKNEANSDQLSKYAE